MKQKNETRTRFLVQAALLAAVIVVMAFTPLGYLRTPGLSITFLTVPVAVGATVLGPAGGAVCGLTFGLTSFIQCFVGAGLGTILLQINPLGTAFICIVPRLLEGWLCGLLFRAVRGFGKNVPFLAASLACPLLNTALFMGALVLVFYQTEYVQGLAAGLGATNPLLFVVLFVGVQGLVEAVVCFAVASAVSRTLAGALKRV